jgi:purine-binding chemotaxis protein CheW
VSSTTAGERWDDLARAAAAGAAPQQPDFVLRQLLTFELAGAPYAVPVECVREIVRIRPVTPIPRVPDDVRGVISLRGEIVQVIDLRRRLGLAAVEPTRSSRIIVVNAGDADVAGVLVDAVTEVLRVGEEAIRPAALGESGAVNGLCARGEDFVSLLDIDRALEVESA